ncbi:hypothetical protein BDY19DRAFT_883745 [Irpex rosettiformis]|uniref:Uncharacterized protein n=1 Tax=Irpex rosettiformis TaxID=378272 RepID=A0ACB8UEN0_9APHY|nr:hypothetical protein BDY19DRAFT_883745 [Irpex rosettiformis]
MALAWTLDRIRDRTPGIRLRIFADTFHYGFENIAKNTGIYHGERYGANQLLPTMREQKGDMVDLLILGTCEIDLPKLHSELLAIWNERPEDQKFKLVCMVHNTEDLAWQAFIPEWSRRGVLRLVTLGDHVSATFKTKFDELSESRDLQNFTSGYESIPIDAHYPVLDIPGLPQKSSERILSKAVIQGSFDSVRRDYNNLFADLINSLHDNASSWGYHPLIGSRKSFVPDHRGAETPFELYLVGSGQIEIPDELAYMVTVYRNLDYEDFYRFIANCDIVVPAFSSSIYYRFMASSTVALALELNVPILGTLRLRKAYRYIDDDRVVVTRPAAMREVSALKALRTRDASFFLKSDPSGVGRNLSDILGLESAVDNMLEVGWVRQKKDVDEYKQELWHRNELLAERLLRDM